MNALLQFPVPEDAQRKTAALADLRKPPELRTFSRDESQALLGVAQRVHRGTGVLLELIDSHRELAREAGIETVAIELGSERRNVERVLDTLEESERRKADGVLSLEGLELLRRTEKLLAEAESNISRFTDGKPSQLGQTQPRSGNGILWGSLAIAGLLTIGVVALVVFAPGKK